MIQNQLPDFTLSRLRVGNTEVFKKKPDSCPFCESFSVVGVEILGAYSGDILWECRHCGIRMLRFPEKKTLGFLDATKELFYDFERGEYSV